MHQRFKLSRYVQTVLNTHQIRFFPKMALGDMIQDTNAQFEPGCRFPAPLVMPLGRYSYSLSAFRSCERIGRYCSIGKNVRVFGDKHPIERVSTSPIFYKVRRYRTSVGEPATSPMVPFDASPVSITIGHDVWIGDNVTLRDGISVADGAVLGTGSVVTKPVPPYTIVAGNPARVIRTRFPAELVDAFARFKIFRWMTPKRFWQKHHTWLHQTKYRKCGSP